MHFTCTKCLQRYRIESCIGLVNQYIKLSSSYFSTGTQEVKVSKSAKSTKYKHTILFPKKIPLHLSGQKRRENEERVKEVSDIKNAYNSQEKANSREFILHDGPPYANGKLHMGHAYNKIVKDITVRYKLLKGHKVSFVPGWDCHGLPIELKALEKEQRRKQVRGDWENIEPIEIRAKARQLARETIELQQKTFDQWGLFVDWEKRYCTYDASYVAEEIRLFGELYEKGYIFQAYLPVHFSPSSRTSLAESELEYNEEHVSPSLYLALPVVKEDQIKLNASGHPVYLCIWTTTPWTLPANEAVCVATDQEYALIESHFLSRRVILVCLAEKVQEMTSLFPSTGLLVATVPGNRLAGMRYVHPLRGSVCPVLEGSHVTSAKGTGLVHTAPAHGKEDFAVALAHGLDANTQLIDERGLYKSGAGSELAGKHVLEGGNEAVIEIIRSRQDRPDSSFLLHVSSVTHSYPYDWRTKRPTIVRASKQWFFHVNKVKAEAKRALEDVKIYPEKLRNNFVKLLENRPYWCISRQRAWGVPVPVFYESDSGEPLVNRELINHVADIIEQDGPDVWWSRTAEELLPASFVERRSQEGRGLPEKGADILDIWFDSGSSWRCASGGSSADLCVEGLDQTNGWFQSSLLIGVAATGRAPYRTLLLHNFTVDENKQKMSKSLGNVFDPEIVTNGAPKKSPPYGVDVLRWWVSSCSPVRDIPFGRRVLEKSENDVRSLKTAFSFMVGALSGFSKDRLVEPEALRPHDQYLLSLMPAFQKQVWEYYEEFELEKNSAFILDFIVQTVGNDYVNSVKDILYFEDEFGWRRRSVLSALSYVVPVLCSSLHPILPFLSEQVAALYTENHVSFSIKDHHGVAVPAEWSRLKGASDFKQVLAVREDFARDLTSLNEDQLRQGKVVDPVNFKVKLKIDQTLQIILQVSPEDDGNCPDLCSFLRVSEVDVEVDEESSGHSILVERATTGYACSRCRRYVTNATGELCERCENVLKYR